MPNVPNLVLGPLPPQREGQYLTMTICGTNDDPAERGHWSSPAHVQWRVDKAVAAERERLKADAEGWGNALNAAGWAAVEAYRSHTGQVEPAIFFNHAKGIVRDALAAYFRALRA